MIRALAIFVACLCGGCAFIFSQLSDLFDALDMAATGCFEVCNAIANPDADDSDDSDDEPRTPGGGKRKPAHA